ncbi:hypothetical protein AMK15_35470 [Streptomyces sp. MJM1172]|nr:hypothetical protein AMK15_35470 [Streptomyces sp. MJM1172]
MRDKAVEEREGSGETQFGADGLAATMAADVDAVGEALDERPSVPARPVGGARAGQGRVWVGVRDGQEQRVVGDFDVERGEATAMPDRVGDEL